MKDKNMIAVDTYNKIAQEYDKEFGNDYSDTPYVDKFLNYLEGKKVLDSYCLILFLIESAKSLQL